MNVQSYGNDAASARGQRQRFVATTAELAGSHRLSRFLYVAEKSAYMP